MVEFNDRNMDWYYKLKFSEDYSYVEEGTFIMKGKKKFQIGKNKGFQMKVLIPQKDTSKFHMDC